jgi:hypothetical protein
MVDDSNYLLVIYRLACILLALFVWLIFFILPFLVMLALSIIANGTYRLLLLNFVFFFTSRLLLVLFLGYLIIYNLLSSCAAYDFLRFVLLVSYWWERLYFSFAFFSSLPLLLSVFSYEFSDTASYGFA